MYVAEGFSSNVVLFQSAMAYVSNKQKAVLTVRTFQFAKQLAKWVQNCEAVLTSRRQSWEVYLIYSSDDKHARGIVAKLISCENLNSEKYLFVVGITVLKHSQVEVIGIDI